MFSSNVEHDDIPLSGLLWSESEMHVGALQWRSRFVNASEDGLEHTIAHAILPLKVPTGGLLSDCFVDAFSLFLLSSFGEGPVQVARSESRDHR